MSRHIQTIGNEEITRENVYVTGQTCKWCGQVHQNKSGKYLYRYTVSDGWRRHADRDLFCSKSCRDIYYN